MSGYSAADPFNPYASPSLEPLPASVLCEPAAKPGSVAIVLSGLVLLLVGYLFSNLVVMSSLYHVDFGPGAGPGSPFAEILPTAFHQWIAFGVAAGACILGAVMIGSQRFNPMTMVVYVLCPLAGFIFAAGLPLRMARRFAEPVALSYLMVGACLACTGITKLIQLYEQPDVGFIAILASLLTEAGLAMVLGAIVKFARMKPIA